ncbi:hypothetical protein DH2020_022673 [Rehmannia glutinosa]|uniref:RING-type E3 ubiquitin transferase n=1 Tax=Rehmannia glutinosa TaxID=99300 RepID=A0ABR0W4N7_REHGL
MLPHIDINFKFSCDSKLSEWVIIHVDEQEDSSTSVERVLVRELNNRPVIENIVPKISCQQFLRYTETRQTIDQVLRQLMPLADDEERRNFIEYAMVKAEEIVKSKPLGRNVLDLHFNVTVQHDHVFDGINIDESSSESYSYCMVRPSPIKSLKRKRMDSSGDDESCCICLEDLNSCDEALLSTPCSHVFHSSCITKWLTTSHSCPICRFEMASST